MCGYIEVKRFPPVMSQNEKDAENAECESRHSKEIDGDKFLAMVPTWMEFSASKEYIISLRRLLPTPYSTWLGITGCQVEADEHKTL